LDGSLAAFWGYYDASMQTAGHVYAEKYCHTSINMRERLWMFA